MTVPNVISIVRAAIVDGLNEYNIPILEVPPRGGNSELGGDNGAVLLRFGGRGGLRGRTAICEVVVFAAYGDDPEAYEALATAEYIVAQVVNAAPELVYIESEPAEIQGSARGAEGDLLSTTIRVSVPQPLGAATP